MLTLPINHYKNFAKVLTELRKTCDTNGGSENGLDTVLDEFYGNPDLIEQIMSKNHTSDELYDVLKILAPRYMKLVDQYYQLGDIYSNLRGENNTNNWKSDPRHWIDPLATPLPNATRLKIYCSMFSFYISKY